jgi:hypothetical protein
MKESQFVPRNSMFIVDLAPGFPSRAAKMRRAGNDKFVDAFYLPRHNKSGSAIRVL